MVKISKDPLRNNPQAIFAFISKHIFLAKYSFYIKRDPRVALKILNDAKDRIKTFKLDNLDISVKERIKQSEFNKYVQQALSLADKQM